MEELLNTWKWYVAGPLIGITVPLLLFFGNKLLGVSSSFRHFCSMALPKKRIEFLKYDWTHHKWNLFFVFGIGLGGFVGANLLTNGTLNLLPPHFYEWSGLLQLFFGGLLVGFGTRYAGGCTSGHAISVLSTFQSSSLRAVIPFFVGGVITASLLHYLIY